MPNQFGIGQRELGDVVGDFAFVVAAILGVQLVERGAERGDGRFQVADQVVEGGVGIGVGHEESMNVGELS